MISIEAIASSSPRSSSSSATPLTQLVDVYYADWGEIKQKDAKKTRGTRLALSFNTQQSAGPFCFFSRRHYRDCHYFYSNCRVARSSYLSCPHATWSNWTSLLRLSLMCFFFFSRSSWIFTRLLAHVPRSSFRSIQMSVGALGKRRETPFFFFFL